MEEIISKFDAFAVGEVNETFNNRDQKEGETFESFYAAIRSLAKTCNYCINSFLRDRIVIGIRDATMETTVLKELDMTLEMCDNLQDSRKCYCTRTTTKARNSAPT